MLGRGATLPEQCQLAGGEVDYAIIKAIYACPGGDVVFELRHPSKAPATTTQTARFAITLLSGSPPAGLADALTSRIRSHETAFEWKVPQSRPERFSPPRVLLAGAGVAAAGLAVLGWALLRRRSAGSTQLTEQPAPPGTVAALRAVGLVAILLVSLRGTLTHSQLSGVDFAVFCGVSLITAILWLVVSGYFGYGSACRRDWVGLVPFLVALVLREVFTLHSVQEIEIQFAHGPVGRHSIVYPLLQMFFIPIVRDTQSFTMHMNGVLGAIACLGMYLFVRQRVGSRSAGFLCALFLALHPVLTRFSPTDGPYSLLLATWLGGLALLSTPELDARSIIGGAALLGIAATTRMEGMLFLVASLLMLDRRLLLKAARCDLIVAAFSFLVVAALEAVQMYALLPMHLGGRISAGALGMVLLPDFDSWFEDAVWVSAYNSFVFAAFVWLGAAAGLWNRYRLGLRAYAGMIVVLAVIARSWGAGFVLHRMIPAYALQAMIAGMGAYSLLGWIPAMSRWRWLAVIPGTIAATYVAAEHHGDLTKPYVFTEEYELVRSHLAPGGVPQAACALMTFNAIGSDIDIHDFGQVVPGVKILDCRRIDCVSELSNGGCVYYVRSAACYLNESGVPAACAEGGVTETGDRLACMNERCASFEKSVELQPVETRTIDIRNTFNTDWRYPAEVGLFRVRSKNLHDEARAAVVRNEPQSSFHEMPTAADDEPAIPPGQEELLAAMLGRGVMLAGDRKLTAAEVGSTKVDVTYTCANGDVEFELTNHAGHPQRTDIG
jgi:hypothetical protein